MMTYAVSMDTMKKYLNLEIDDNGLFPDNVPIGTSFYALKPDNDCCCVVKIEHLIKLLSLFIQGYIDDNRVKDYVETLVALDLYAFDDEDDQIHDLISNTIFTLDEIKDVQGEITKSDARKLLDRLLLQKQ